MRKEKTNKAAKYMVVFMAAIMVLSVFGVVFFGFNEPQNIQKYKDASFTRKGDQWSAIINNKEALFNYFPTEAEGINLTSDITPKLLNKAEIDATYDFNDSYKEEIAYSAYELGKALGNHFNSYLRIGSITNTSYSIPIITCADSTPFVPVIHFKSSNETNIYSKGNCIIIEAKKGADFIKIKDRLLYALFDIIYSK